MSDYLWHSVGLVFSVWQVVTTSQSNLTSRYGGRSRGNHTDREKGESLSATPTAAAWGINKCAVLKKPVDLPTALTTQVFF